MEEVARAGEMVKVGGSRQERHEIFGIPVERGELWTARQRQMHRIHYTVSYRASFKPELPDFFIRRYCLRGDEVILDPFGGRGTTIMQANLLGFRGVHNDANPVAHFLAASRQFIPPLDNLQKTLEGLELQGRTIELSERERKSLTPFFHRRTIQEIMNFRKVFFRRNRDDPAVRYLGLTALSRLYGHSDGFFSVYTFPQISIMPGAQRKNNLRRNQRPQYRSIKDRILRKLNRDLKDGLPSRYHLASAGNKYTVHDARRMNSIASRSVDLIVTSPPFLNKVNYIDDNWMRAWFLDLEGELESTEVTMTASIEEWADFMLRSIREFGRVLKIGGRAVIEVGEVTHIGKTALLEEVLLRSLPLKINGAVLKAEKLYLNEQSFTKLSNCWDIHNNCRGTNTNRCLVIVKEKPGG